MVIRIILPWFDMGREIDQMRKSAIQNRFEPSTAPMTTDLSVFALARRLPIVSLSLFAVIAMMGFSACQKEKAPPLSATKAQTPLSKNAKPQPLSQANVNALQMPSSGLQISLFSKKISKNEVAIIVSNRATSDVRLRGQLDIERYTPTGWTAFNAQEVSLRYSCEEAAESCVLLVPGAELHPPPWQAASGPSQCRAGALASAPIGRYRFVAKGCDNDFVVHGEPFDLSGDNVSN
jgi:hypothetical protein